MAKKIFFGLVLLLLLLTSYWTAPRYKENKRLLSPLGNSWSVLSMIGKSGDKPEYIVYGFLPYWSVEQAKFIQFDKLTDIAYFGLRINAEGTIQKFDEEGNEEPGYVIWKKSKTLDSLIKRSQTEGLRFSLTIISHNDEISTQFLECDSCWKTLVNDVSEELNDKGIIDINLNFEYTEFVNGDKSEKYSRFVDYFNKELDKRFGNSFVVVSTFADSLTKPRITDITTLPKVSDALFVMAYDFHRPNSDNAGPVAPIRGAGVHAEYDISTMLKDYLTYSPPEKLILGVPYYGYNWVVSENKPYAERIPGNDNLGFSQSQTYADIMENLIKINPHIFWDELGQNPYYTYISPETGALREVYFDDVDSLRIKYRLLKDTGLAGVGIWAIGYDRGYQELWNLLGEEF